MIKIIAEIASSHNGDLELAKVLIKSASENGADIVKFQDWRASNVPENDSDKERYEKYQFKDEWYPILIDFCKEQSVEFLTTCFNADRCEFLAKQGLKKIKLASISLTNKELILQAGANFEEVILSTAMHTKEEIEEAIDWLSTSCQKFTIMHCVANYPMSYLDANLERINELKKMLPECGSVGFSDHSLDLDVAKMAMCMDIKYLEKHFTLSRDLPQIKHQMFEGAESVTTHHISIEPRELKELTEWRNKVEAVKGNGEFKVNEVENLIKIRYNGRYGR